jgi:hypothetical protein
MSRRVDERAPPPGLAEARLAKVVLAGFLYRRQNAFSGVHCEPPAERPVESHLDKLTDDLQLELIQFFKRRNGSYDRVSMYSYLSGLCKRRPDLCEDDNSSALAFWKDLYVSMTGKEDKDESSWSSAVLNLCYTAYAVKYNENQVKMAHLDLAQLIHDNISGLKTAETLKKHTDFKSLTTTDKVYQYEIQMAVLRGKFFGSNNVEMSTTLKDLQSDNSSLFVQGVLPVGEINNPVSLESLQKLLLNMVPQHPKRWKQMLSEEEDEYDE